MYLIVAAAWVAFFILFFGYLSRKKILKSRNKLEESGRAAPGQGYKKITPYADEMVIEGQGNRGVIVRSYNRKNKNQAISVEASVTKKREDFFGISFSPESNWASNFSGLFGLTDVRSGEPAFDAKISVSCPSRLFAQNYVLKPQVRELVLSLIDRGFTEVRVDEYGAYAKTTNSKVVLDDHYDFTDIVQKLVELGESIPADYTALIKDSLGVKNLLRYVLTFLFAIFIPAMVLWSASFEPYIPVNLWEFTSMTIWATLLVWVFALSKTVAILKQTSGYHKTFAAVSIVAPLFIAGVCQTALVYVNGIFDSGQEEVHSSTFIRAQLKSSGKNKYTQCYITAWDNSGKEYKLPNCYNLRKLAPGTPLILGTKPGLFGKRWFSTYPKPKE